MKAFFAILPVVFIIIFIISLLIYFFAFAYSPYYTHPDLTEEIAKLFNLKNNNQELKIFQNEIEWMRKGAINEDVPPRWINHFYNPITKTGWSGKHFGNLTPEQGRWEGESMAPKQAIASIDWVTNQGYQAVYGRQYGNQTWQKAIKSYIDGDKKSAFVALGHILHLIEDVSVPDHTRDDTHADLYGDPGSPYEKYSKEYTNFNKLNIAENSKNQNFFNFSTIEDAFNYLANYSNKNFFSEDTISNEEFNFPNFKILEEREKVVGGQTITYIYLNDIYLARKDIEKFDIIYTLQDDVVMSSYLSHLSQQAVLAGASVLNLFFQEVEKYKNNPELLPEIIPDSNEAVLSYLKKSPRLALVNIADVADKTSVNSQLFFAQVGNAVSSVGDFFSGFFQDTDSNELSANLSGQISSSKQLVQYEGFQTLENQINQIIEQQSAALNENESQAVVSSQITERQRLLTEIQAKLDLFKIQAEELNQREKQLASLIPTQIFFSYDRVGGGGGSAIAISSSNDFQNSQTENQIIANNSTSTDESQTNNQAASLTETAPATIISPANHLVISEIQAGVDGNSNNEFVELYNPTDNAVNLSDWSLKRKTSQQATSTRNLVSDFGATSTIAAKSFFLIAHRDYSNYSISTIPDLFYTNNSNPLAYDDDVVILYNGADEVIDEIYYQNIEVGKSWERKAVVNNQCATASSSNEFLGNGCDINSPLDFEIRGAPNPQNSQSFSEPRNAPTTPQNFAIKYSSSTMTLNFNWQESQDYNGATSTITYKITDISNNSSTLPEITAISTSASVVIDEIGRDYNFFIQAFDKEGLGSEIATSSISVPNFLSSLYFYKNSSVTNADYLIESFYDQYPFIPDVYQNGGNTSWKAMIFYLNSEAAKEIYLDSSFSSWYPWPQEIKDKILKIKYNTCAGGVGSPNYILILPDIKENCSVWGGLRNISFGYKYEDKNFAIAAVSSTIDTVFTANDYLTVAYYSFYSSGWWKGLPEVFRLVAVDKTKYYFGQSPIHQPPTSPSNLNAVFNATSSNLIINWDDSVDIDSLDSLIKYELNYHLDGEELDESKWQEVIKSGYQIRDDSGNLNPIIQTGPAISVSIVDSYKIYLRAKDEFGNYSEIISINWAYPVFLE